MPAHGLAIGGPDEDAAAGCRNIGQLQKKLIELGARHGRCALFLGQAHLQKLLVDLVDQGLVSGNRLGVAGVALFISLLTQSQSRLGQLAPLWAMGVTRRQLMLLNLGQTWLLALLTLVLAVPLGWVLAWCLNTVINVQAFGWRLPLYVFPMQLLQLTVLGMFTSLLACAWPLWQLARRQPRELLRPLADEA